MKYCAEQAFAQMNSLGGKGIPFFFLFDFDLQEPFIIPLDQLDSWDIELETPNFSHCRSRFINGSNSIPLISAFPISFDQFESKFLRVKQALQQGDTYLLNLTQPTPVQLNSGLKSLFAMSQALYKIRWADQFVSFSPERFVSMKGHTITTNPMKGTIDAKLPNAMERLLSNKKELAEHSTIVDLLRNDLNRVAKKIKLERFRYVDTISTEKGALLQVSSQISGELLPGWQGSLGDIFHKLLPAGSVTGAPKPKTIELIRAIEGYNRGYYTGVFGIFDGNDVDSAVLIRFIEHVDNQYVYKSGGGITAMSEAQNEYRELIQKVYVPVARKHITEKGNLSITSLASGPI